VAEKDVGRLVHRVAEHQRAHRGSAGCPELFFHGGVPADFRDAHQAQERDQQLVQRLDPAVREYRAPVRVEARRQVVRDQPHNVAGEGISGASRSVMVW